MVVTACTKEGSCIASLEGRFTRHHGAMCRLILDQVRALEQAVAGVEMQVAANRIG